MKIDKKIEHEIKLLKKEQEKYVDAASWDYKYRYYMLSGKIDILQDILSMRKIKLKNVEMIKQKVTTDYKEIRKIPKHQRNEYQYLEGIYLEGKLDIINKWLIRELSP
jgi:hypothetical protein